MDPWNLIGIALTHLGSASWAIVLGALLWSAIGVVLAVAAYQLARRRGWLDVPGQRRWGKVTFGLVLALLCLPLVAGAGAVTGLRDATTDAVRDEVARQGAQEALGELIMTPLLAMAEPVERACDDCRFLRDDARRRELVARVTVEVLRAGLDELVETSDRRVWRWLRGRAEAALVEQVQRRIDDYDALFRDLRAEDSGGLPRASAAKQVGGRFLDRHVYREIEGVFDSLRLQLLIAAVVLPLAALLIVRLIARRRAASGAGAPPAPAGPR